jgi:DnaK suppressor protein
VNDRVLDETTLSALRDQLEAQRAELRKEIEELGADPDSDDLSFADDRGFSDRSHSAEERLRLISVSRALRSNLRDVERALTKMETGTYGTCERCGNQIALERLEALPWALLCIDCKQKGISG